MSYTILLNQFRTIDSNGKYTFYLLTSDSNVYYAGTMRRGRDLGNLENYIKREAGESDLVYLKRVHQILLKDAESGGFRGLQKTADGFIGKFEKQTIKIEDFDKNADIMERRLGQLFPAKSRTPLTEFQIEQQLANKPFIAVTRESIPQLSGKTVMGYNAFKQSQGRGRIKEVYAGGYGFFPVGRRNRYYPISSISFVKIIK